MNATDHPDYTKEKRHLDEAMAAIQSELGRPGDDLDRRTRQAYDDLRFDRVNLLKDALPAPYFGRVEWLMAGHIFLDASYIGKVDIPDAGVTSWASDSLATDLYYTGESTGESGQRLLRRTVQLAAGELKEITDEVVDAHRQPELAVAPFADSLLARHLQASRAPQLRDIVATLQPQQYQIVRLPKDQLLVLQGRPGSGKTLVALHRAAYLAHNYRDSVKNVLVLVPNGLFVGALKNVLPSLGERETSLRTFDQWIIEMLGTPIEYERQDQSLETLLDSSIAVSEKVMRYRNAQNKGSLKMAALLERYVAILYQGVLEGKTVLVCATSKRAKNAFKVERTPDDLRRVLDEVRHLPFNQRRDAAERRLVKDISHELVTAVLGSSYDENGQPYRLIESHVQRLVHQYFTGWNSLNAVAAYRRLLSSPDLLRRAGDEIFDDGDLELMTCEAPGGSMPFRFGDLAALLYLKILLDGKCDVHYDHIVIDEAHDITPMFFEVLSEHSQASMTLLSDLAQGLYFHHAVKVWDELARAMDEPSWRLETIRESYRSTQEIAEYANAMLRRLGVARDELAQPISRSGPAPALHHFRNRSTLIAELPGILRGEQASGHGSIAVVCKTLTACRALAAELAKAGFTDHRLITDRDVEYMGGTVILPSYLTNGLEFDAVVLADADANTYAPDELNARLLYVAITRAAHSLHVCWVGAITLFLDEDHSSIVVQPMLGGSVVPGPVTIEAYVNRNPRYSADECVQSLAAADKLWLLKKGVVDEMLLEIEMRAAARAPQTSGRGVADLPIDRLARADLQEQVAQLSSSTDEDVKSALAFLQLAYGLLRDWMPGAGAARSDDGELHDQVIQMATLMRTLRANGLTPGIPPQTTRSRALQAVAASRRETAERLLSALIDLGIVEELDGPARAWLRVPADRVQGMLELSLGHTPNEWEPDWVAQLPRLSAPLVNVLDKAR